MIDSSALVEWLLRTPTGFRVAHRVLASSDALHAPELIFAEVPSAFKRMIVLRKTTVDAAEEGLRDLANLRLKTHPHLSLVRRVWDLRDSVSAYDAMYIALAERLDAPLLTCDRKLAATHGHQVHVEHFELR